MGWWKKQSSGRGWIVVLIVPLFWLGVVLVWRRVNGVDIAGIAMREARELALTRDAAARRRTSPRHGLLAYSPPPKAQVELPHTVRKLMKNPKFRGFWPKLPRGPALEFSDRSAQCWEAAKDARAASESPSLPVELTNLARYASVEPFDCAACSRPRCEPCAGEHKELKGNCCHELLGRVLLETAEWLNQHGVTWFLFAGTLLGAVRDKGVIPWTNDIDIAIWKHDLERLPELSTELEHNGKIRFFKNHDTIRRQKPMGQVCVPQNGTEPHAISSWRQNSEPSTSSGTVDMFPFELHKGRVRVESFIACRREFTKDDILPVQNISVLGAQLPVPRQAHAVLAQIFGPSYMEVPTGDKKEDHWQESNDILQYCRAQRI